MRHSTQSAGLVFCVEFKLNLQRTSASCESGVAMTSWTSLPIEPIWVPTPASKLIPLIFKPSNQPNTHQQAASKATDFQTQQPAEHSPASRQPTANQPRVVISHAG